MEETSHCVLLGVNVLLLVSVTSVTIITFHAHMIFAVAMVNGERQHITLTCCTTKADGAK